MVSPIYLKAQFLSSLQVEINDEVSLVCQKPLLKQILLSKLIQEPFDMQFCNSRVFQQITPPLMEEASVAWRKIEHLCPSAGGL